MPNSKKVLIRSYGSGVHYGTLVAKKGTEVKLKNARRLWYWTGANTLNELALRGATKGSKISEPVPEIEITGVLEVLLLQPAALKALDALGWGA
jgi:hypothetical protein